MLLLCGTLTAGSTPAQAPAPLSPLNIEARVEPDQVTVGDLATYTIQVRHAPGFQLTPPQPENWKGFELTDQGISAPREIEGQIIQEFWFRLRGDRVGYYTLEGPAIAFQAPDRDNPKTLIPGEARVPDVKIQIRSVLYSEGEPEDIHDLKPIIGAAPWWKQYVFPLLGFGLFLLVAGYLVERWLRKYRKKSASPPPAPPVPLHELALRELQRLYDKGYIAEGRFRDLYFELSEIFRRYLGERYHIPALDWTTEEIAYALNAHLETPKEIRTEGCRILNATDLVKFAKLPVEETTALEHMKAVADFIRITAHSSKAEPVPESPVTGVTP